MKKKITKYIPFPIGTIRGPYHDRNQTQFLVQTKTGWVPFIRTGANAESEAFNAAGEFNNSINK